MKSFSKIAFILFIIVSAVVTFVYIGFARRGGKETPVSAVPASESASLRKLTIAEGDYSMRVGQSHQLTVLFDDGSPAGGVMWSSTDDRIASVDGNGRVNAIRVGEVEIYAVLGKDQKARIALSVYDEPDLSAADAVKALAADGGDDAMKAVETVARSLSKAKDKSIARAYAVLKALLRFKELGASGDSATTEDWNALVNASAASDLSLGERTLRQAALAAYCQGEKSAAKLTISFAGDCTFARFNEEDKDNQFPAVYRNSGSVTYPFDLVKGVFGADDITMVNFEGAMTTSKKHKDKRFYFRGDPSYVSILTGSSVESVTVENNHAFDYYDTGFNDTLATLKSAGVRYTTFYSPSVIDMNNFRIVMLSLAMVDSKYLEEFREQIDSYIKLYKGGNSILVMNIHWGVESEPVPTKYQRQIAHMLIDSGVDMIIGHHPHVLQGIELYKGHYIVYSLGNFSFGGNTVAANPYTIIFRASFGRDSYGAPVLSRVSAVPCLITSSGSTVNNYRPTPVYGKEGRAVVNYLMELSAKLDGGIQSIPWNRIG